jgi:ATP-binding cassette subfamily F protein 3
VNVYPGNYEDYLWRKEGKEISLDLTGLEDLVRERNPSHPAYDADPISKAQEAAAVKSKRLNPIRLQQMKDRCREIEEQVARLEAEIEGQAQELAHFRSAEDSVRLTRSIEQGRQELAGLMREWEATAKVIEEQESGVGE